MDIYNVKIVKIEKKVNDIYTYYLEIPDQVKWEAGAHMHVGLPGFNTGDKPNKELVRHMSISTLPEQNYLAFTTRLPQVCSEFKTKLKELKEGDTLSIFKIGCIMHLQEEKTPMIFISNGVGMATIYPMVLKNNGKDNAISLHVSKSDEHIFKKELESVCPTAKAFKWADSRSSFYEALSELTNNEEYKNTAFYYVIGGDLFLEETIKRLLEKQIRPDHIIIDKKPEKREFYHI